jgi:hypothetical protein
LHRGFLQAVKRGKFLNQAMQWGSAQIIAPNVAFVWQRKTNQHSSRSVARGSRWLNLNALLTSVNVQALPFAPFRLVFF